MLSVFGSKAPGVAWFGRFLVPLGVVFGSFEQYRNYLIEKSLFLSLELWL